MTNTALPVNSIAVGDCIATMNSWPAASLDLIFADPPYNIGYKYDQYEDKQNDADYIAWTQNWITACARLLKPTGSFYILIGDEYAAETRLHLKHLERIIKLSSNETDIVFDPFTGSGTTLAVAARLKRQWLGCELSDEYAAKATERIEHTARTGSALLTTQEEKGMTAETRKKKPEPKRSAHLQRTRTGDGSSTLF